MKINATGIIHNILRQHIKRGAFCIDATAGKGRDTAFLCECVGIEGRVIAFDIQHIAIEETKKLVFDKNFSNIASVICDGHENMDKYAEENTVDCIMFNFGWLPSGDHKIFTQYKTSIVAIEKGLNLLKNGGIMSLCIYSGKDTGFEEKERLLEFLKTLDDKKYTVIISDFYNRPNNPPLPVFIIKE